MRNYKTLLTILAFSPSYIFGQTETDRNKIQKCLDSLSITLNSPIIPEGFTMTYGCDSVPYFKKIISDTILFLTPSGFTPMTYEYSANSVSSFSDWLNKRKIYPPSFPTRFDEDGRIEIANYSEIRFFIRNDSLFEKEFNQDEIIVDLLKNLEKFTKGRIDSITLDKRLDKLSTSKKCFYMNKLIFSRNMFAIDDTVKIPLHLNARNATIILLNKWFKNDLIYYKVLINEKHDSYETECAYSFDENFKFINWEGCEE